MDFVLRALHVLGIIMWIGGTAATALMVVLVADDARAATAAAGRKVMLMVATPGLLLAWAAGLTVLIPNFTSVYAKAGWMHGKLTIALIISGLTGVLVGKVKKAAAATDIGLGAVKGMALGVLLLGAISLFFVFLKPFQG
ncbi:MAG: CopD family protein [Deltaproteobacteria bacterium]|nr:CopD family protein [Deltaproteobacteria bacterium]